MPDEVRVKENDGIIEVVSCGVLTRQDMEGTKTKLQQIRADKKINRILIDTTRVESVPSTSDIFEALVTQPPGFRIAILVAASNAIIQDVAFAETVGVNRGKSIKVFLDAREARRWLKRTTE
jgi:hypothetical protein